MSSDCLRPKRKATKIVIIQSSDESESEDMGNLFASKKSRATKQIVEVPSKRIKKEGNIQEVKTFP